MDSTTTGVTRPLPLLETEAEAAISHPVMEDEEISHRDTVEEDSCRERRGTSEWLGRGAPA